MPKIAVEISAYTGVPKYILKMQLTLGLGAQIMYFIEKKIITAEIVKVKPKARKATKSTFTKFTI